MQLDLPFAALAIAQSICTVAAVPLKSTPLSSLALTNSHPQRPSDQSLAFIPSLINLNPPPLRQYPNNNNNNRAPPSHPNTTSQTPIPYRVPQSPTTLLFHTFGPRIPASYILQCLSISLSIVLEKTLQGKGRDPISNGLFTHTHLLPNKDNVTITVVDFREVGRPMVYYVLRDMLKGIGEFMTETGRMLTTVSYEVDVDGVGYVGTGHIDYFVAGGKGPEGF